MVSEARTSNEAVRAAHRKAALTHTLAVLAPVVTIVLLLVYATRRELAVDFRADYWAAAQRVLHGGSPYLWTRSQLAAGEGFPYPAVAALLLTPFGLLSQGLSAGVFVVILLASVAATFRVLDVRDWRVYAFGFLLFPVINGWQSGNLTLLLGLLIALAWRYRDRPIVLGLLVALTISVKPFVWPLALWLVATRRLRAALWALLGGLLVNAAAWSVLGYGEISRYLRLDHAVTNGAYHLGYSVMALAVRFGASEVVALGLLTSASAALATRCALLGWARRDRAAFVVAVGLMLVASPLVWNHYLALLIVPLAVARPRLSREWLILLPLWLCPSMHVAQWEALLAAGITVGIIWQLSRTGSDQAHILLRNV